MRCATHDTHTPQTHLVAGQRAERVHIVLGVQQLPQALGAEARERVLDLDAAAQLVDVLLGVDLLGVFVCDVF